MNKFLAVLTVFLYPIFSTIYYYLPPFTSIAAILAIRGHEKKNRFMLYMALAYMLNIEINYSLPMFSTLVTLALYYWVILPRMRFYTVCRNCLRFLTVIIYNLMLIGVLFAYDYLFFTDSAHLDLKIIYNIVFELMAVLFL